MHAQHDKQNTEHHFASTCKRSSFNQRRCNKTPGGPRPQGKTKEDEGEAVGAAKCLHDGERDSEYDERKQKDAKQIYEEGE